MITLSPLALALLTGLLSQSTSLPFEIPVPFPDTPDPTSFVLEDQVHTHCQPDIERLCTHRPDPINSLFHSFQDSTPTISHRTTLTQHPQFPQWTDAHPLLTVLHVHPSISNSMTLQEDPFFQMHHEFNFGGFEMDAVDVQPIRDMLDGMMGTALEIASAMADEEERDDSQSTVTFPHDPMTMGIPNIWIRNSWNLRESPSSDPNEEPADVSVVESLEEVTGDTNETLEARAESSVPSSLSSEDVFGVLLDSLLDHMEVVSSSSDEEYEQYYSESADTEPELQVEEGITELDTPTLQSLEDTVEPDVQEIEDMPELDTLIPQPLEDTVEPDVQVKEDMTELDVQVEEDTTKLDTPIPLEEMRKLENPTPTTFLSQIISSYGRRILHTLANESEISLSSKKQKHPHRRLVERTADHPHRRLVERTVDHHHRRLVERTADLPQLTEFSNLPDLQWQWISQPQHYTTFHPLLANTQNKIHDTNNLPLLFYGWEKDTCLWKSYRKQKVTHNCHVALFNVMNSLTKDKTNTPVQDQEPLISAFKIRMLGKDIHSVTKNIITYDVVMILIAISAVMSFVGIMYKCLSQEDGSEEGVMYPGDYRSVTVFDDGYVPPEFRVNDGLELSETALLESGGQNPVHVHTGVVIGAIPVL